MRQAIANPTARAELRHWPGDCGIAHLILLDVGIVPTTDEIAGWVRTAFTASGSVDAPTPTRIRTGALFPAAAKAFLAHGFVEADRLALLERPLLERVTVHAPSDLAIKRLRDRDLPEAADIDRASFPEGWQHDHASLHDIATATPQARLRLVTDTHSGRGRHGEPTGFAVTGRAGPNGYLQRLAVRPEMRGRGAGRLLVDDALAWLTRRGARRAMVNTGVDNQAALALYAAAGFDRQADELLVVELERPT